MTVIWSLLTVTVGPAILAFLVNTVAPKLAEKVADKLIGSLSDRLIDWFCRRSPKLGEFLFRKVPQPTVEDPAPPSPQEPVWFYSATGKRCGPVPPAELRRLYSVGELTSGSMVWRDGMPTWATLASVENELPPPPKVRIDLPPRRFTVGPGGAFVGLFLLFFALFAVAAVGAYMTAHRVG
jgi:hypothetical protein